jgi:hypothetical protein
LTKRRKIVGSGVDVVGWRDDARPGGAAMRRDGASLDAGESQSSKRLAVHTTKRAYVRTRSAGFLTRRSLFSAEARARQ